MLAYYWVLATPTIGFLFGCYLYVCVNWFRLHYDEAFSSLRIPHYKGFCRLRITPGGELHIYSLGMDRVRGPPTCTPLPASRRDLRDHRPLGSPRTASPGTFQHACRRLVAGACDQMSGP